MTNEPESKDGRIMTFWQWADRNPGALFAIVAIIGLAAMSIAGSCSGSDTDHSDIRLEIGPEPTKASKP